MHRTLCYYLIVTPHIYLFSRYRGLSCIEVHHTRRKARIPWCHDSSSRCNRWTGTWYRDTAYIFVGFYCMRLHGSQEKSLWLRGAIIHWLVCCCLPFYRSKFENFMPFLCLCYSHVLKCEASCLSQRFFEYLSIDTFFYCWFSVLRHSK